MGCKFDGQQYKKRLQKFEIATVVVILIVFLYSATSCMMAQAETTVPVPKAGGIGDSIVIPGHEVNYEITDSTEILNEWSSSAGNVQQSSILNIDGKGNNLDGNGNDGISLGYGKRLNLVNLGTFGYIEATKETENAFAMKDANGEVKYYVLEASSGYSNFQNSAIRNNAGFLNITNSVFSNNTGDNGGSIYNHNGGSLTLDNVTFINNSAKSGYGGAIYNNYATIESLSADFVGNNSTGSADIYGGAIYNYNGGTIKDIAGYFINNYTKTDGNGSVALGGAIYNSYATIGNVDSSFFGNYASSESSTAQGGAIYNYNGGTIGDIVGDFYENYATSSTSSASGGAIYNWSVVTIGDINGNFVGNYASASTIASGGAIHNYNGGKIGDFTGSFIDNYVSSSSSSAFGGAIYNEYLATIGNIDGDFIGNYASGVSEAAGGAIYNFNGVEIGNIKGNFINNYTKANGLGALAKGGAIYNNYATIGEITNSSFINNYAKADGKNAAAKGGAIFLENANLNIVADSDIVLFSGNYTETNGVKEQNAIYVTNKISLADAENPDYIYGTATALTLDAKKNGTIQLDDKINGGVYFTKDGEVIYDESSKYAYNLKLTGDDTGNIIVNNEIKNAHINIDSTNVTVTNSDYIAHNPTLAVNSGTLSLRTLNLAGLHYDKFTNNGVINIENVSADLANKTMGSITAEEYGELLGNIDIKNILLTSDAKEYETKIFFTDEELAQSVNYSGPNPIAYSPIYKYQVDYDSDNGMFTFTGGPKSSSSFDNYNPAVLASSVASLAGAYVSQLQMYNYAFQHSNDFMNSPYKERLGSLKANRYALSPTGDATDVGTFSPLLTSSEEPGIWLKTYSSFESIPLSNGPKVSNISYGSLVGYDTPLTNIAKDFSRVITGYIGYNGASQRYQGVDAYQNGGLLGSTVTLYKNNFFNATTLSVGATAGSATNMYGSENFTMLVAGIGNKVGYNFEFKEGKYIVQPSLLLSYTFINTFDYNNAAGLRIQSDPLNAIQIAPGVKFITNTKNGWQPYLGVSMVWNVLDKTKVSANDVRLPEMSIDPYIQYGVGVQKRWKDKLTFYIQSMFQNGGRNGISLTAGLRWSVGKS